MNSQHSEQDILDYEDSVKQGNQHAKLPYSVRAKEEEVEPTPNETEPQTINEGKNSSPIGMASFLSFVPRLISDLTAESQEIDWLWEGYLGKNLLTLLSAFPKSGKSSLVSQLLRAMQDSSDFAGQKTRRCKVLILSEESETSWARRREDLGLDLKVWIVSRSVMQRLSYGAWIQLLTEAADFCKKESIELLVVDTLSGFWNVSDENSASQVESALLPFNRLLNEKLSILLVHHFRKAAGSEGTASRGSGALGAKVDIMLEFSRVEQENPKSTQRKIKSFSRFEETPIEIVIELSDNVYQLLGTVSEVNREAKLTKILQIVTKYKLGLTSSEILDSWDPEIHGKRPVLRSIRNYIDQLLEEGRLIEKGTRKIGKSSASLYFINEGKSVLNNEGKENHQDFAFEANNEGKESGHSYRDSLVNPGGKITTDSVESGQSPI